MSDDTKTAEHPQTPQSVFGSSRVLAGKYVIGRLVGEGGMGSVYEAEHRGLGSKVAIKLLSEAGLSNPKSLARFKREARAMAAINHENVVKVMDTGSDDEGVPYLVMELLEGESLSTVLRRERVMQPELASWIISQILAGLVAAHSNGVIHRDLKPGNIFICRQDDGAYRIKILDFGISKIGNTLSTLNVTAAGAMVGTPNFMAPEQIRAVSDIDGRVDVYATGVIFYRMVTGHLPFSATTADELYKFILDARPIPPRQHNPMLPQTIEDIITRAMHPDRDRRFASATEFLSTLRENMPTQPTPIFAPSAGDLLGSRPPPTQDLLAGDDTAQQTGASNKSTLELADDRTGRSWALLATFCVVALAALAAIIFMITRPGGTSAPALSTDDAKASGLDPNHGPVVTALPDVTPLVFGVLRHTDLAKMKAENQPLLTYLEEQVHHSVQLKVVENYTDLAALLSKGTIDLAALPSYQYVQATQRGAKIQLLATPTTKAGTAYEGYILVRSDSDISTLKELTGKKFCYVSHTSSSGYLYPRAVIRRAGMDPDRDFSSTTFTSEHTASLIALKKGICDGAAVYASAWLSPGTTEISPSDFSVVAKTEKIPWDAYAVRSNLDANLILEIREALLRLKPKSSVAKELWDGVDSQITGFVAGDDALYDSVREIAQYFDKRAPQPNP